jgi:hypothetical protein
MTQEPGADEVVTSNADREGNEVDAVMGLLAEHVPLALLADLVAPDGPVSQEILETEGLPEDAWWEADDSKPAGDKGGS